MSNREKREAIKVDKSWKRDFYIDARYRGTSKEKGRVYGKVTGVFSFFFVLVVVVRKSLIW